MAADPNKLRVAKEHSRPEILFGLARKPGSQQFFVGASDASVYDFDLAQEKPEFQKRTGHEGYVVGVAWTGKFVVTGATDGKLVWWQPDSRDAVRTVEAHTKSVRGVVASPDGRWVASIADDMHLKIWEAETGKLLHDLVGHATLTPTHFPSMLYALTVSNDGKLIATADKVGHIVIWEAETGKTLATLEAPEHYTWDPKARRHSIGGIRCVAFSPDNRLLAVGGMGKVGNIDHLEGHALVHLFDWQKGERLAELTSDKFKGLVEQVKFDHEGKWLVATGGANDGFIWFIDPEKKSTIVTDKAPMHVHSIVLDENSETIWAAGYRKLLIWELKAT